MKKGQNQDTCRSETNEDQNPNTSLNTPRSTQPNPDSPPSNATRQKRTTLALLQPQLHLHPFPTPSPLQTPLNLPSGLLQPVELDIPRHLGQIGSVSGVEGTKEVEFGGGGVSFERWGGGGGEELEGYGRWEKTKDGLVSLGKRWWGGKKRSEGGRVKLVSSRRELNRTKVYLPFTTSVSSFSSTSLPFPFTSLLELPSACSSSSSSLLMITSMTFPSASLTSLPNPLGM